MSGLGSMIDLVEICGRSLVDRKGSGTLADRSGGLNETSDPSAPSSMDRMGVRQVIEAEIVPRLLLSHAATRSKKGAEHAPTGEDVAEMARIVVAHDFTTARSFISAVEASGVDREGILLELIAPTARLLGELWAVDRCTWAEVSMGLSQLQTLALELSWQRMDSEVEPRRGRVLLAPVPGEQHTLGLRLVTDLLRADGWDVVDLNGAERSEILRQASEVPFDAIGLTVSNDHLLPACRELIRELRSISTRPNPMVLVGGALSLAAADVEQLGADATATDGREVVRLMQQFFERMSPERDAVHE